MKMKPLTRLGSFMLELLLWVFAAISALFSLLCSFFVPYRRKNYQQNLQQPLDGFIWDQQTGQAANLRMGYRPASYNGCGWIATYNALLLLNQPEIPAEIIAYYEKSGGTFINGELGINPVLCKHFFCRRKIPARMYNLPKQIDTRIAGCKAAILLYAHDSGAHFVVVRHTQSAYEIYNAHCYATAALQKASVEEYLHAQKYVPLSLIALQ